jgi:predicted dehydrogenase
LRWITKSNTCRQVSTESLPAIQYEESWNYGFPQEMQHFVDCVQKDEPPLVTAEDGRAVLEAIHAAYLSAGTGKAVDLPLAEAPAAAKPIDLWLGAESAAAD